MISSMAMPSEGTFSLTQVNLRKCIFKFEKRGYLQIRSKPQEMLGELFHHLGILQGLWGDLKTGNVQLVIEGKFFSHLPAKAFLHKVCYLNLNVLSWLWPLHKSINEVLFVFEGTKNIFFWQSPESQSKFSNRCCLYKKTFRNAMKHAYKETALIVCMFLVLSTKIVTRTAST